MVTRQYDLVLPTASPFTRRELRVLAFGRAGARPKAYLQASLHADEIPGMLVLHNLAARLGEAEDRGQVLGEVVVVPVANPVGLCQHLLGRLSGRYDLANGANFNRGYPDLAPMIEPRVAGRLSEDAEANTALIRRAATDLLAELTPADEVEFLRVSLMRQSVDADIALDLHCDWQAVLHLYLGTPLWPAALDLAAQIGSRTTLLATCSGGNPFDEALAGIWWSMAERFPTLPIPPACLAGTVELRGESDVSEASAARDADSFYRFLQRRGVLAGDPGPLPRLYRDATPLEGVHMLRAPQAGVVSYARGLGEQVQMGDVVAVIVDPQRAGSPLARTELRSEVSGVLYARRSDRMARPGQVLCRIAGKESLPERVGRHLLSD
jgi:predicted deacylase